MQQKIEKIIIETLNENLNNPTSETKLYGALITDLEERISDEFEKEHLLLEVLKLTIFKNF